MTPEQYITENYENIKLWLRNVTQGQKEHLYEDLIHEVIMIFLEHDKAQDAVDTGTVRFFLTRIALNQFRSSTSPFHYQYRNSYLDFPDGWEEGLGANDEYDPTTDTQMDLVLDGLDSLYQGTEADRYEAIMVIMYYSMGANYSAVGRKLDMQHTTVRKLVLRGLTKLKKIIFNNIEDGNITDYTNSNGSWNLDSSSDKQQTLSLASRILRTKYFDSF